MNNGTTTGNDLFRAAGYAALLMLATIPLSFVGMQVLNFIFGNIK
jgi:hypothetical protein